MATIGQAKPEHSASRLRRARQRLGALRFSVAQFLGALILLLVTAPFVEQFEHSRPVEAALLTFVLLSAVPAIGGSRRMLVWGIVLVAPAVAARWLHHALPTQVPVQYSVGATLVFVLFVLVNLLRFVLRAPRVNSEVLCAGIASYLMLGLIWAFAYLLVNQLVPNSFGYTPDTRAVEEMGGFTGVYFSFVTLSTVGYGDIVPLSPVARMLATMEAMTGTIFIAVLISRLVALYTSEQEKGEKQ